MKMSFLTLLLFLFSAGQVKAVEPGPVIVDSATVELNLTPYVSYLEDSVGLLSFNEIEALDKQNFKFSNAPSLNFGTVKNPYWFYFVVWNKSDRTEFYYLKYFYGPTENIYLFFPGSNGKYSILKSGIAVPVLDKPLENRSNIFPIELPPNSKSVFYMRVQTRTTLAVELKLIRAERFLTESNKEYFYLGHYYGLLIMILLYNLFVFFTIREPGLLFYGLYVFSYGIYQASFDGLAAEYFWPSYGQYNFEIVTWSVVLYVIFGFLFIRNYLDITRIIKKYDWLIWIAVFASVVSIITMYNGNYVFASQMLKLQVVFFTVSCLLASGYMAYRGEIFAKFVFFAFLLMVPGFMIRLLRNIGALPETLISIYSFHFGSIFEMVVLAFGIGYRIKYLKDEHNRIRAKTRERISQNLHDELGSTISSISFFAEAEKREKKKSGASYTDKYLNHIIENSEEAKGVVRDLIWAVDSRSDCLIATLVKMKRYLSDHLDAAQVKYDFPIPELIQSPNLDMEVRHEFWLAYKEIVNNLLKHSKATEVKVENKIYKDYCLMTIIDNGIGFNIGNTSKGHGLSNIRERFKKFEGTAVVESKPGFGTQWTLIFPIGKTT